MLGLLIVIPVSVVSIVIFANLMSDLEEFIDPHDWEDIFDEQYEDWEDIFDEQYEDWDDDGE